MKRQILGGVKRGDSLIQVCNSVSE